MSASWLPNEDVQEQCSVLELITWKWVAFVGCRAPFGNLVATKEVEMLPLQVKSRFSMVVTNTAPALKYKRCLLFTDSCQYRRTSTP